MEDQLYRTGEVIQTKSKFPYNQPDQNLGHVPEQRSVAEDDNHSDNVARFLQELDAESPKHFKHQEQPKAKQIAPYMNATKDKELKMAYIEHERATPDQFNGRQTMNGKINQSSANDLQNIPLNFPDKSLIKVQSIQRILDENLSTEKKKKLDFDSILHKELDFDKVIPRQLHDKKKKDFDNSSIEEQHPFDMSFENINDLYGYISDGDKLDARRSLDDIDQSALQTDSDASFGEPQEKERTLGQPKRLMMLNAGASRNQQQSDVKHSKSFKKMKTIDFSRNQDPLNQTGQSTMYNANESVQHEMISKNDRLGKSASAMMLSDKKSTKQGIEKSKKKQDALDIYKKIDDTFIDKQPADAHKIIETDFQKISINPGVPYISTSQDAVFEIRNAKNQRTYGRQVNQFIAIQHVKEEDEDSGPETIYIRPQKQPYQLKNCYKIVE